MIDSICLISTLLISITSRSETLLAIQIINTRLKNKIDDEFIPNSLTIDIEKDTTCQFDINSIMAEFDFLKRHETQLFLIDIINFI